MTYDNLRSYPSDNYHCTELVAANNEVLKRAKIWQNVGRICAYSIQVKDAEGIQHMCDALAVSGLCFLHFLIIT